MYINISIIVDSLTFVCFDKRRRYSFILMEGIFLFVNDLSKIFLLHILVLFSSHILTNKSEINSIVPIFNNSYL